MKSGKYFLLIFISLLLLECQKEDEIKFMVFTGETSYLMDGGICFNGYLNTNKSTKLSDHGFNIYNKNNEKLGQISLGVMDKSGKFSSLKYSGLDTENIYSVAAYASSDNYQIESDKNEFHATGIYLPVVEGVYPDSADFRDTLSIFGKNLTSLFGEWEVLLNTIPAEIVEQSDTLINFMFPLNLKNRINEIIFKNNRQKIESGKFVSVNKIKIDSICPLEAYPNEEVRIYCSKFGEINKVSLYVFKYRVPFEFHDNYISFKFPQIEVMDYVSVRFLVLGEFIHVTKSFKCL